MYLIVWFMYLFMHNSHFILFGIFSLSNVFNMSLWLGRLCKHFPRLRHEMNYSIDSRINITTFFNFPDMFRRYIRHLQCNIFWNRILDSAATKYQVKLKESMFIKWEKPDLNQQVKHINLTLSL